jgi:hypothetical protein
MELLVELVVQLAIELFGELLLKLGFAAFKQGFRRRNHHPAVAALGYLALGACLGGVSVWIHPERYLGAGPLPGISLVLAPLAGGVAMHLWGGFRRAHGRATTNLATFLGGASLMFAYALVRLLRAR